MDCPVRRLRIRRCWTWFEENGGEPTPEQCPYAPCSKCHYRLGWEIGLLGDSLFEEENEIPSAETLVPLETPLTEDQSHPAPSSTSVQQAPTLSPAESPQPNLVNLPAFLETADEIPTDSTGAKPPQYSISEQPKNDAKQAPSTGICPLRDAEPTPKWLSGATSPQKGMRFCWELLPCPNPRCPVRERQIVRCFKFFEPKGDREKLAITGGDRLCSFCHYKRGWELGILHEGLFEDILEKKRIKRAQAERIKRQGLVEIYLNELSKKPMTKEQEMELAKKIAGDKDAAELFLMANLKLVVRIASSFTNRGLSLMDLIQEGNLGLIKAISKFDWTLGYRFSTYAAYWIRHYMQQAISNQARVIRVPHHLLAVAHKIKRTINEMQGELQRAPTLSELSKALSLEEEKILEVLRITETPISIEARKSDNEDEEPPEYYIADRTSLSPEEEALEKAKAEACRKALDLLPARLKEIAEYFYGFREEQLSLAEIGRRMGISRERARQLLAQALEQLKNHEFVANMKDFL